MSTTEPTDELVAALRSAAQDIFDRRSIRDLEDTLSQIVAAAVATVPGAVAGGISRTQDGTVLSQYQTDALVGDIDARQSDLREGPCIDAAEWPPDDGMIYAADLAGRAETDRWPRFAPYAAAMGYRSLLSTHLGTRPGGPRAALNLYAAEPDAFDVGARTTAGVFAVQAAALLYGADEAHSLRRAVDSRDLIGRAKGILMERFALDDAEAFQMLVKSSQDTNVKLVHVAEWLQGEAEQRRDARRRKRDVGATDPADEQ